MGSKGGNEDDTGTLKSESVGNDTLVRVETDADADGKETTSPCVAIIDGAADNAAFPFPTGNGLMVADVAVLSGFKRVEGGFSSIDGNSHCLGGETLIGILSDFTFVMFDCRRKGPMLSEVGTETSLAGGGTEAMVVKDGFTLAASFALLRGSTSSLHSSSEIDSYVERKHQGKTIAIIHQQKTFIWSLLLTYLKHRTHPEAFGPSNWY